LAERFSYLRVLFQLKNTIKLTIKVDISSLTGGIEVGFDIYGGSV
jgi:hypothetical protein